MHANRYEVVEDAIELMDGMGLLAEGDVKEWRDVLYGLEQLDYMDVSLGVKYLDIVKLDERRGCFMKFGLSPYAADFGRWAQVHGLDSDEVMGRMWFPNRMTGFYYGRSDHLLLVEEWEGFGFHCAEIESWKAQPLTLGPPEVHGIRIACPVVEACEEKIEGPDVASVIQESQVLTAESVAGSPVAMLFREEVRREVVRRLGLTPTFHEILECELPMVSSEELASFDVVVDGSNFEVGRWFGKRRYTDFLSLVSFACSLGFDGQEVRSKLDGLAYRDIGAGLSYDVKTRCCMFLHAHMTIKDSLQELVHETAVDSPDLGVVQSGVAVGESALVEVLPRDVGDVVSCGKAGTKLSEVLGVANRLCEFEGDSDGFGVILDRFVLRFIGVGADRVVDGVWRAVRAKDGVGVQYRSFEFTGDCDVRVEKIVAVRAVKYSEVPRDLLGAWSGSLCGYSFLQLVLVTEPMLLKGRLVRDSRSWVYRGGRKGPDRCCRCGENLSFDGRNFEANDSPRTDLVGDDVALEVLADWSGEDTLRNVCEKCCDVVIGDVDGYDGCEVCGQLIC